MRPSNFQILLSCCDPLLLHSLSLGDVSVCLCGWIDAPRSTLVLCPGSLRMTSRPTASIFCHHFRAYQPPLSRSQLLPKSLFASTSYHPRVRALPRALDFYRCYTHVAATFYAFISCFPPTRSYMRTIPHLMKSFSTCADGKMNYASTPDTPYHDGCHNNVPL